MPKFINQDVISSQPNGSAVIALICHRMVKKFTVIGTFAASNAKKIMWLSERENLRSVGLTHIHTKFHSHHFLQSLVNLACQL